MCQVLKPSFFAGIDETMEDYSPVTVIKRKTAATAFDYCVICQERSEQLQVASDSRKGKLRKTVPERWKVRNCVSHGIFDRTESIPEDIWESGDIKWHKSFYGSFTSTSHIEGLRVKFTEHKTSLGALSLQLTGENAYYAKKINVTK